MKVKRELSIGNRRTAEFVEKAKSNPFASELAKAARMAIYRKRANEGRDIFTGLAYAR